MILPLTQLSSFGDTMNAVVIGASGGIGSSMTSHLASMENVRRIVALSRTPIQETGKISSHHIDLQNAESIDAAAQFAKTALQDIHLVIVASGLLHDQAMQPEKAMRQINGDNFARAMAVNAIGPALVIKHFAPLMPRSGKTVLAVVSARVGSISDNYLGGWYAYRASKAAVNQIIRTGSIEIARKNCDAVLVALHPGTTDTNLSKPFQGGVAQEHLFSSTYSAECMLRVIERITASMSGKLISWDGSVLPY